MAKIIRDVKFGGGISVSDRRAMALHEYMASAGYPLTSGEIKQKMEELKKAIPYPDEPFRIGEKQDSGRNET